VADAASVEQGVRAWLWVEFQAPSVMIRRQVMPRAANQARARWQSAVVVSALSSASSSP
jgi:hypothetical protein